MPPKKTPKKTSKKTGRVRTQATDAGDQIILEDTEWVPSVFVSTELVAAGIPLGYVSAERQARLYAAKAFGGHYDLKVSVMLPCTTMSVSAAIDECDRLCLEKLKPAAAKVAAAYEHLAKKGK